MQGERDRLPVHKRARYGFRFVKAMNPKGKEVNVGYEVVPETMAHVRRIFEMVAGGQS